MKIKLAFVALVAFGGAALFHRDQGNACVYRQLKRGRSGDEVRPGWRVN
jgi:hypothetical protein